MATIMNLARDGRAGSGEEEVIMPDREELTEKAEDALSKFMDDPQKVQNARDKADGFLGKYMDQSQAEELTGGLESLLGKVAQEHERPSDQ